jgi:hypothetical protein
VLGNRGWTARWRRTGGRAENGRDRAPGRDHGLSGGGLASPGNLGPTRLSPPDLFPQSRQRRPLRGLGTAAALFRGDPRGIPFAPLIVAGSPASGWLVMTPILNHDL